jgi:hypothetical protein
MGGGSNENAQVWQSAAIDANATSATLTYWYWISSNDWCGYDYGYVRVNGTAATTYDLCSSTDTGGYIQSAGLNLGGYIGTSPEIRFQATTDSSFDSSFLIDDVSLNVCIPVPLPAADYSDLAGSYGAAWHTGNGALYLGSSWTADSGFSDGSDDASDDGLARISPWRAGQSATITVTVSGTGSPWLSAWVDWNGDGYFSDPGENIIDQAVSLGDNTITFAIPATYATGTTVQARFRLYDNQPVLGPISAAQPFGGASSGEVEDYTWHFSPTAINLLEYRSESSSVSVWGLLALLAGTLSLAGTAWLRYR